MIGHQKEIFFLLPIYSSARITDKAINSELGCVRIWKAISQSFISIIVDANIAVLLPFGKANCYVHCSKCCCPWKKFHVTRTRRLWSFRLQKANLIVIVV